MTPEDKDRLKEYCLGVRGLLFDYGGTLDSGGDHWSHVIARGWEAVLGPYINRILFRDAYVEGERAMARSRVILPEDDFHTTLFKKIVVELKWYADHSEAMDDPREIAVADRIMTSLEALAREIADVCDAYARRHVDEAKMILEQLSSKFPMALVSNFYGNVESVLKAYGLGGYFKAVVESAVVGVRKPDPKIFSLGVEALGLPADEVLVVGDTYKKDIMPALAAGCKAVWIKGRGWTDAEDAQEYPYIISNLEELTFCLLNKN